MGRFKREYEVGRGKPPVSGQFQKGKSGNPKGRPKGTKNFAADVEEILATKVKVQENGEPRKVSSQRALLMRLLEQGLKGDARAMDRLIILAQQASDDKKAASTERALSDSEEDILARFLQSSGSQSEVDHVGQIVDPQNGGGGDDS